MPRRFHNKSRFGCIVCKARRVKCDERRPTCGGCIKTRSKCQYPRTSSNSGTPSSGSAQSPPLQHEAQKSASRTQPTFDMLDLTLMHRYSTDTCLHLFTGERASQVWQHDVPALAASNGMLMHGMLAIAALHLARSDPVHHDLYRTRALHHHGQGLPLYQAVVGAASRESAVVIVVYAVLLGMWVYAFPETASEKLPLDEMLGIVEIVRSSRAVFHLYRNVVVETPIGILLDQPCRRALQGSAVAAALDAVDRLHSQLEDTNDRDAAYHLRVLMERYLAGTEDARSAVGWMAAVPEGYWVRLRRYQPYAVLVFAYNTILARAAEHECWWLAGWAERILQACREVLRPDDKRTIGWVERERLIRLRGKDLAGLVRSTDK